MGLVGRIRIHRCVPGGLYGVICVVGGLCRALLSSHKERNNRVAARHSIRYLRIVRIVGRLAYDSQQKRPCLEDLSASSRVISRLPQGLQSHPARVSVVPARVPGTCAHVDYSGLYAMKPCAFGSLCAGRDGL
jgi:hypothetical protein